MKTSIANLLALIDVNNIKLQIVNFKLQIFIDSKFII